MIRSTILLLVGLTTVYAGLKSAHPVNNVPASLTTQYFDVPQTYSLVPQYEGVVSVQQPAPYPGVSSVSQSPQYVEVPSAPQHPQYVAVTPAPQPQPQPQPQLQPQPQFQPQSQPQFQPQPQPQPYVSASPAAPQPSYVAAAPQPASYSAEPASPQPTTYMAVTPKFNSVSVYSSPTGPATSKSATPTQFKHASFHSSPASPPTSKFATPTQLRSGIADKDAQIVSEGREVNHDGTFDYGFNTENGISVQSRGYIKPANSPNEDPIQVIEGLYQYIDAYGKLRTIKYIADENGYRAYGDDIPQPHEAILKALAHRR